MGEAILKLTPDAWHQVYAAGCASDWTPRDFYLRVGVHGGGCSGFEYDLDVVVGANPKSRDITWQQVGERGGELTIAVDPISAQYLRGCVIHYYVNGLLAGFRFENPQAKSTCGCGHSFSA
jgi:iron-sulfur cluster assembly accessory protein